MAEKRAKEEVVRGRVRVAWQSSTDSVSIEIITRGDPFGMVGRVVEIRPVGKPAKKGKQNVEVSK